MAQQLEFPHFLVPVAIRGLYNPIGVIFEFFRGYDIEDVEIIAIEVAQAVDKYSEVFMQIVQGFSFQTLKSSIENVEEKSCGCSLHYM